MDYHEVEEGKEDEENEEDEKDEEIPEIPTKVRVRKSRSHGIRSVINRSISNALKTRVDRKLIKRENAKKNDRRHSQSKNL